ncbi:hypothetical protein [Komagataeibacter xylinus]|uniref:hypothetical protein n=1 Tax=Komagataeibacter xylinus TaxID=28448 RepID=UPI001F5D6772|nr:hypothetical protein [Komagataeibacter xylinus]
METKVGSTDLSNANTALNALATIVRAFKALLDSVAVQRPVGAMAMAMSSVTPAPSHAQVHQALRVLGVTA